MKEINEQYFRRYAFKLAEANILAGDAKVCEKIVINFEKGTTIDEIKELANKLGASTHEYLYEPGSSYLWICSFDFVGITFLGSEDFHG